MIIGRVKHRIHYLSFTCIVSYLLDKCNKKLINLTVFLGNKKRAEKSALMQT